MATSAPPLPTPAPATRSRDWPRPSENSPFGSRGRGGGGGKGRSRGGRGRSGGAPTSGGAAAGAGASPTSTPQAPAPAPTVSKAKEDPKPAASGGAAPAPASEQKSTPPPGRPKGHGRRASRSTVPTVVVEASSPSTEAPATTSRSSNRRRRSQQLPKGNGNAAGLKVNVPASDDKLLRPQGKLAVPHSAPPPSKDTPPHLAGSFDIRHNIDALVERVRAVAMDHRPSTPGSTSHIDWAGDDDESLPDLDDWGVKTSVDNKNETISPIIVDGLKPLPEPAAKPIAPSDEIKEQVVSPFVLDEKPHNTPPETNSVPIHPSLPRKPVTGPPQRAAASGRNVQKPPAKTAETATGSSKAREPVPPSIAEPKPSADAAVPAPPAGVAPAESDADVAADSNREGLEASMHASAPSSSNRSSPEFNLTHHRAQTVGRSFPQSAPVNFNNRFSRSGTSTPRGGYASRNQHARTHSSPPAGSALSNHRAPHSRPIITGDAISRLARTIAAPANRAPPAVSTPSNS